VRFKVVAAVSMKTAVCWVVAQCSLVEVYRHFRGACCLHHQGSGRRLHGSTTRQTSVWNCVLLSRGYDVTKCLGQPSCVIRNDGEVVVLSECCEFDGQNCWSVCVLIFGPSQLVQERAQSRARVERLEQRESLLIRQSYNGSPVQQVPKTCSSSDCRELLGTLKFVVFHTERRFFAGPSECSFPWTKPVG
jgi:hypothetical protein